VESLYSLRQEEPSRNMYDVTITAPHGLGLALALLASGALMVRGFNPITQNAIPGSTSNSSSGSGSG
jgi:hypothetical protein